MRKISFLFILLFFSLVPQVHADPSCEGRFVNPITDVCWRCIFPLSLGSVQVGKGDLPDTSNPELDYNLQHSYYNGTVKNQLAADYAEQRKAISTLAQHYGVMFFYRGREAIDGQLVQVIKNFRETYGLSVIPVSVDGVINPMLPDSRTDQGQAEQLGVKFFPAMMLVNPKSGQVKPLSYGFISQDDLAKQFLYVSSDFKPNF